MQSMGFPRDQCEAAFQAAYFNAERAIEYLLNGIPEQVQQPPPMAPPQTAPGTNTGAGATPGAAAPTGGQADFSALTSNPMFAQLRERML